MGAEWRHAGVPIEAAEVSESGIGASWSCRSADFARDGFALSSGPVLPPDVVAAARSSFEAVVARADEGQYALETSMDRPHVQLSADLQTQMGAGGVGLRKVEMPQLDRQEAGGIVQLMNHPALAAFCAEATGADWLQVWWIQLHGKPPAAREATEQAGDGTSIGFHQVRGCLRGRACIRAARLLCTNLCRGVLGRISCTGTTPSRSATPPTARRRAKSSRRGLRWRMLVRSQARFS